MRSARIDVAASVEQVPRAGWSSRGRVAAPPAAGSAPLRPVVPGIGSAVSPGNQASRVSQGHILYVTLEIRCASGCTGGHVNEGSSVLAVVDQVDEVPVVWWVDIGPRIAGMSRLCGAWVLDGDDRDRTLRSLTAARVIVATTAGQSLL